MCNCGQHETKFKYMGTKQMPSYHRQNIVFFRRYNTDIDLGMTVRYLDVMFTDDNCNSLLASYPKYIDDKLQKLQKSAARLILKAPKHKNVTPISLSPLAPSPGKN